MCVRFTEFLKSGEDEINLYFVQERTGEQLVSFSVYVKSETSFVFTMVRKGEKNWTVAPHTVPEWILQIKPDLVKILEQKASS